MNSFEKLGLHTSLVEVLQEHYGFSEPTDIQKEIIPILNSENPMIFTAETGSGKTLAYLLPILDHYMKSGEQLTEVGDEGIKVLLLAPTRILAREITDELAKFGVRANVFIGGENSVTTDSIFAVATPGKALLAQLEQLDYLVLDEGDRLLDMEDAAALIKRFRKSRLVVCSATTGRLREVGGLFSLVNGVLQREDEEELYQRENSIIKPMPLAQVADFAVPETLRIELAPALQRDKIALLCSLVGEQLERKDGVRTVVFALTCAFARYLTQVLRARFSEAKIYNLSGKMHANMQQHELEEFKKNEGSVLVTTDVAARGLDIDAVGDIIEFDLPKQLDTLIHRAGRTARAGRVGRCVCICHVWETPICDMLRNRGIIAEVGSNEIPEELGQYADSREVLFLRTQLNKVKDMAARETAKPGASQVAKRYNAEIEQLEAQIAPLEAREDEFNAGKLSAFDTEMATFLRDMNQKSMEFETLANEAFVSYIRAYQEYELKYICEFSKLDLGELAMAMGLLSLPRMRETVGRIVFKGEHNKLRAAEKEAGEPSVKTRARAKASSKTHDQAAPAEVEPAEKPSTLKEAKFGRELDLLGEFRRGQLSDADLERLL